MNLTLHHGQEISYFSNTQNRAIKLALEQFSDDLKYVLGANFTASNNADTATIRLLKDDSLSDNEGYRIEIDENQIRISHTDHLGAVYGLYHISHAFLGFDPLWFWKQVFPPKQQQIIFARQTIDSIQPVYHYRGWFLNDEDLLSLWHTGGGKRDLDYPHYQNVAAPSVMKRVYEALLRLGGNLIIPGSFVNVMNSDEAKLVTQAVEQGLYVSQHHIEPLGVTAFSFETYWEKRGQKHAFEYAKNPEPVRQTWRDYAQKWWELAGKQTIWQLGLRGRGDRPIWDYDPTISKDKAGQFISQALADQWQIVREFDTRPTPLATTTLWAEGSELMAKGQLTIPKAVTIIFSDNGQTQLMQDDFHNLTRDPSRTYGSYYHAGFWIHGSHLVQGTRLDKMQREVRSMIAKGDTHYAILNTANIREHVLPIAAFSQLLDQGLSWDQETFMQQWAPAKIREVYNQFFDAFVLLDGERSIQDGYIWMMCLQLMLFLQGKRPDFKHLCLWPDNDHAGLLNALDKASIKMNEIVTDFPELADLPTDKQIFFEHNLQEQARMMGTLYRLGHEFLTAIHQKQRLPQVLDLVEKLLADREIMAQGIWENWYRGETKECWESLRLDLNAMINTTTPPAT